MKEIVRVEKNDVILKVAKRMPYRDYHILQHQGAICTFTDRGGNPVNRPDGRYSFVKMVPDAEIRIAPCSTMIGHLKLSACADTVYSAGELMIETKPVPGGGEPQQVITRWCNRTGGYWAEEVDADLKAQAGFSENTWVEWSKFDGPSASAAILAAESGAAASTSPKPGGGGGAGGGGV